MFISFNNADIKLYNPMNGIKKNNKKVRFLRKECIFAVHKMSNHFRGVA